MLCIDFKAYLRGSSSDWNCYAEMTEEESWGWDNVQTYFRGVKPETVTCTSSHADYIQNERRVEPAHGINSVSLEELPDSFRSTLT